MGRFRPAFHPPPPTRFRVPDFACLAAESNTAPKRSTPVFFSSCRCAAARLLTLEARSPILRLRNSPGHYFRKLPCPPITGCIGRGSATCSPSPLSPLSPLRVVRTDRGIMHHQSLFESEPLRLLKGFTIKSRRNEAARTSPVAPQRPPLHAVRRASILSPARATNPRRRPHRTRITDLKRGSVVTGGGVIDKSSAAV